MALRLEGGKLLLPPDYTLELEAGIVTLPVKADQPFAIKKNYAFHSAHIWVRTEREDDGTPVLIMGHNAKHDNVAFFGGLRANVAVGEEDETPQITAMREFMEETGGQGLLTYNQVGELMAKALMDRTWFNRQDTKGLRHVHFVLHVPRDVGLVARVESNPMLVGADELDYLVVVPLDDLRTPEGRRRHKIRVQCDTALDLYFANTADAVKIGV